MYDSRLIGTWRSDAKQTGHELAARRDIPPRNKSGLRRLFGKLELRYTRSRCYATLNGQTETARYEVVAKDSQSVAIVTHGSSPTDDMICHLHFESSHLWVTLGSSTLREFFRRIDDPAVAPRRHRDNSMCMMLYMATTHDQPLLVSHELYVEEIESAREAVRQWLSLPIVRFVGAHTGCSCGFPSITADEPVEHFDGVFSDAEAREADLVSLRLLFMLVREHVTASGEVQLYAVWDGEEALSPKGTINVPLRALDPERFFFNERFLYRVTL